MKKIIQLLFLILSTYSYGQAVVTNPSPIEVDQPVTITIDVNTTATDCNHFNNPTKVYMHAGIGDDTNAWGFSVVGNWGQDDGVGEMTNNGNGTWSITITPQTYFNLTSAQASAATKMGMVFRNEDGSQEYKDNGCTDFILNVGAFQVTMINPDNKDYIIVSNGGGTQILAQNTNGNANYELFANGTSIHTQNNVSFYNGYLFQNLTENQYCELVITQGTSVITKSFVILVNNTTNQAMPAGLQDGINYDSTGNGATLVLTAPLKDFIYVAGSFNNWKPGNSYAMKKDPATGKFWVALQGLTPGTNYTYQYWVADQTPLTDSPDLVKTADPYSTLVLSPFDDPWIPANSYPNLPTYPAGQEREVTVLNTGETPYNWQVTNFTKPAKEDLIIYELLIRDFDAHRTFQDLIDRIDYFKNLHINAIELMPVMEFEGNEGWGYNPSFHLALDKFYGTKNKLKELIDICHQNGIAVILDVALNHAFGRNPMERMWMIDDNGDGWGAPSSENPYFNETAHHAYGIGYDFNHQSPLTKYYTKRVIKHWIEEFKIDGFRWDLTKGFTQNCTSGDENCTNAYQQDRVDVLKEYADYAWSIDPTHYVIFEHLGNASEEQQWADYRINEGKGIMLWGKEIQPYNELIMAQNGNKNFEAMGHTAHNFAGKRLVGYFESHDEERIMYNALQYGNSNGTYNITDLNTALSRMPAIGALSLLIPGPKMIWHFGDLGMEQSLNTCTDGTVDPNCRLATKPQPQWVNNWLSDTNRNQIYNAWARLAELKTTEAVFKGEYDINSGGFTPRIYIWDNNIPISQLKNVIVVSNLDMVSHNVTPYFPYTGTWYNLMDNSSINVTNTNQQITLNPGEFRVYGNQPTTLNTPVLNAESVKIYPNPATNSIHINIDYNRVEIYNLAGQLVHSQIDNQPVNVAQLQQGMYLIKVFSNNTFVTKKLILKK